MLWLLLLPGEIDRANCLLVRSLEQRPVSALTPKLAFLAVQHTLLAAAGLLVDRRLPGALAPEKGFLESDKVRLCTV
jgi:hypothetical protein